MRHDVCFYDEDEELLVCLDDDEEDELRMAGGFSFPQNTYITEDALLAYVTEDGTGIYVTES